MEYVIWRDINWVLRIREYRRRAKAVEEWRRLLKENMA
jgi:hypothetical protein